VSLLKWSSKSAIIIIFNLDNTDTGSCCFRPDILNPCIACNNHNSALKTANSRSTSFFRRHNSICLWYAFGDNAAWFAILISEASEASCIYTPDRFASTNWEISSVFPLSSAHRALDFSFNAMMVKSFSFPVTYILWHSFTVSHYLNRFLI